MSIDDDLTQLDMAEVVRFGQPWHGKVTWVKNGISGLYDRTLTTDTTPAVTRVAGSELTVPAYVPTIARSFTRPGQPAATTTPEEAAEGMEWRNSVVAPPGLQRVQGNLVEAGPIPFVDEGGNVWIIQDIDISITQTAPDATLGTVYLQVLPESVLDVLEARPSPVVLTYTWGAGAFPVGSGAGWGPAGGYQMRRQDIRPNGREWLYKVHRKSLYGDLFQPCIGLAKLVITGTGAYTGLTITGLSVGIEVIKTESECAMQQVSGGTSESGSNEYPGDYTPPDFSGWDCDDPRDYIYDGDYTATTIDDTRETIIGGYFLPDGSVRTVRARMVLNGALSWAGSYASRPTWSPGHTSCNASNHSFSGDASYEMEYEITITDGVVETTPVTFLHTETISGAGGSDNSGAIDYEGEYSFQGTTLATYSHTETYPSGGLIGSVGDNIGYVLPGQYGAIFPSGFGLTPNFHNATQRRYTMLMPFQSCDMIHGFCWGFSESYSTPSPPSELAFIDGAIVGWISPAGLHAGADFAERDGEDSRLIFLSSTYAEFHPRHSSYNTHNGSAAVNEPHKVYHV